ncbi:MAG: RidA family protein [Anaerolineales bacterium]|nr:RidA family protein [Anaerolineales bacterium]
MQRQSVPAGTIYAESFGYSRAVRVGDIIHVGGTTATDAQGRIYGREDMYTQTLYALNKIKSALEDLGASVDDVVRTRVFVTNIDDWQEVARAHGAFFSEIKPASALIEVSRLIDPDLLVEIEADAVLG